MGAGAGARRPARPPWPSSADALGRPGGERALVPGAQRELGPHRGRSPSQLGLQPLGVTGTIDDWRTQDVATLEANLRAAIRPGGIVLVHDGGGDRWGTVEALGTVLPEWLAAGWRFTRPAHPDLDAASDLVDE